MIITIDGPVASGKSSVAKALARKYGLYYLYTGLLYRGASYLLAKRGIVDATKLTERSRILLQEADVACLDEIVYSSVNGVPAIIIGGQDVTNEIMQTSFDRCASVISSIPLVREKLLAIQRDIAKKHDIVADGRDCGTVVFPNADYKFYLTARCQERAQRLAADPERNKKALDVEQVKQEIEERDLRDMQRSIAPLTIPDGAIVIDNSGLSFDETVACFTRHLHKLEQ